MECIEIFVYDRMFLVGLMSFKLISLKVLIVKNVPRKIAYLKIYLKNNFEVIRKIFDSITRFVSV